MSSIYKNIGIAIKIHRIKAGLTRKDLANLLNVTPSLIAKWENNSRTPRNRLDEICKYLFITPNELFESCDYKPKKFFDVSLKEFLYVGIGVVCFAVLFYSIVALITMHTLFNEISSIKEKMDIFENLQHESMYYDSLLKFYSTLILISSFSIILLMLVILILESIKSRIAEVNINKDKTKKGGRDCE